MAIENVKPNMGDSSGRENLRVKIVELVPDDWQRLRDLKLKSLEEEPIVFEDQEEGRNKYTSRTEAEWRDILEGKMSGGRAGENISVFAESGTELIGMVSAIIPEGQSPDAKSATIQHMYIDLRFRGQHIGRKLFGALLEKLKGRGDLRKLELQVVSTQTPAIEMYRSFGFREVGRKSVRRGGNSYEELEMEFSFSGQS